MPAGLDRAARAALTASAVPRGCSWTASSTSVVERPRFEPPLGRVDDHDLAGAGLPRRRDRPVDHRPPAQRVQQLRRRGAHARALPGGEDDDDGRGHGSILCDGRAPDSTCGRSRGGRSPRFWALIGAPHASGQNSSRVTDRFASAVRRLGRDIATGQDDRVLVPEHRGSSPQSPNIVAAPEPQQLPQAPRRSVGSARSAAQSSGRRSATLGPQQPDHQLAPLRPPRTRRSSRRAPRHGCSASRAAPASARRTRAGRGHRRTPARRRRRSRPRDPQCAAPVSACHTGSSGQTISDGPPSASAMTRRARWPARRCRRPFWATASAPTREARRSGNRLELDQRDPRPPSTVPSSSRAPARTGPADHHERGASPRAARAP